MTNAAAVEAPDPSAVPGVQSTRRGRHRDHALASWRRSRAVELKVAGRTYQQIAEELGYANRGTVHRIVAQSLAVHEVANVETLRHVELERLNMMTSGLWERGMQGHVPSAIALLRIIEARCRLLGLYPDRTKDPHAGWDCCQGPPTVVIRSDDCRHEGCMKHGSFSDSPS